MTLHPSIAEIDGPEQMMMLPRSREGWPVPWFVSWVDGEPDFRIIKPDAVDLARNRGLCWLCGYPLGMQATYVAGPMCGINRNSAEPPSHHACATYAAKACPFLSRPHARRRDVSSEEAEALGLRVPGTQIRRNPGVAMLWRTVSVTFPYRLAGDRDVMFRLPDPLRVDWFCEGREATLAEVKESIASGIGPLRDAALSEGEGAVAALHKAIVDLHPFLPREPDGEHGGA